MEYPAVLQDEFTEILDGGFCVTIDLKNYGCKQGLPTQHVARKRT